MGIIKKNLLTITLLLTIVGLVIFGIIREHGQTSQVRNLKDTILLKDSLKKIRDGEYSKLVNDNKTPSDLKKDVNSVSEQTGKDIKKNKEKIISNTGISVKPNTKTTRDTVFIDTMGIRRFTSFYPTKDSAFVTHRSIINGTIATNTWEFKPLKLNIIVTQQKDGMYKARLIGPTWIQAQEVTVNSLPMDPITEKKFKYLIGGSGGYSFESKDVVVGVYTGFRYKNKIVLIHGETNKVVSLGYIQEF